MKGEAFEFGSGEWIIVVGHGAKVSCGAVLWEEKVTTGGEEGLFSYSAPMGLDFVFASGAGVAMTAARGAFLEGAGFLVTGN